ncbi:OPT oligopeptide transporter protein-domain-containing protein [Chytriomyces cf. hyalinus JEL632]|nr:OPT oligopeptide transporter protein-domain-containing protein [Chytriomyces cf. hyalinus JEL632]
MSTTYTPAGSEDAKLEQHNIPSATAQHKNSKRKTALEALSMRSYRHAIPPAPSAPPDEVTVHPTPLQSDEADENDEDMETEEEQEKDTYIDEIYQIIDSVVPRTDRPKLPALTFRVWLLGLLFGTLFCIGNTIFTFRTNVTVLPAVIPVLMAYPCGRFLARVLPRGILNPGRFNHKEHALIYVISSTMSSTPYALNNVIVQRYLLNQTSLSIAAGVCFAIVTQCFGYGFAGVTRRYLVRPAAMLWPSTLATIAMLNSLHRKDDVSKGRYPMSRFRFFFLASSAMFFYTFLPQYVAPMLSAISVICWFVSNKSNNTLALVLGSSSPGAGVGFLSFTLDWSLFSTIFAPITSPLWAVINQFIGIYLFMWIVVPLCWWFNAFDGDQLVGRNTQYGFALNTAFIYDKNGTKIGAADMVSRDNLLMFNQTLYDSKKPIYITTYFAIHYCSSFIVFVAALVHVLLWYGPDIWHRLRTSVNELDSEDIHAVLMDVYPEVPDWWYIAVLLVTMAGGIWICSTDAFQLPWWGVVVAVVLAIVSMVPIGIIQAISGQQIGLNVMSEFLIGLLLPGKVAAVMTFKTFSYMAMYQGLNLTMDMKMGHYMKIPPRSLFLAQLVSTIWGACVSTTAACALLESFGTNPTGEHYWKVQDLPSNSGWNLQNYNTFFSAGVIWGAIGPVRFFGQGSPYFKTLLGFVVGFILPVIPWLMHKIQPNGYWHLINIPLITVLSQNPYSQQSNLITPLLVAIFVNYYLKLYRTLWWKKYAYVMSAAFDAGSSIAVLVIFFFAKYNPSFTMPFPVWFMNPADTERCLPDRVLKCLGHKNMGDGFGGQYVQALDPDC